MPFTLYSTNSPGPLQSELKEQPGGGGGGGGGGRIQGSIKFPRMENQPNTDIISLQCSEPDLS